MKQHPLILHLQLWYQCTLYIHIDAYIPSGIEQHGYINPSSPLQAPVCNYRPVHPPILFASAALKSEITLRLELLSYHDGNGFGARLTSAQAYTARSALRHANAIKIDESAID
uniref:Uncharacterized protein n=1 Tax=Coccidioides posadasii RMSCC 3488 TaxID=454284 RepID=A0A0J6FJT8_COCPO|nr:hypothetical protein CPAG_05959 [Coccidioides posadasii RMSCC 3488]